MMRSRIVGAVIAAGILIGGYAVTQGGGSLLVTASANGRYYVQNGQPWMMVGDSPQSLVGNVDETTMASYFADRQAEGFNAVWVNLLCAGYTFCNSDGTLGASTGLSGTAPFTSTLGGCGTTKPNCYDLSTPNSTYFTRVDDMLNLAKQYGLVVLLDPIPTDGISDPGWMQTMIQNGATADTAYGQFLGNRYKNFTNIIWQSGNDLQFPSSHVSDMNLVADVMQGIKNAGDTHLQSAELDYPVSTSLDAGPDGSSTLAGEMTTNAAYTYQPTYDEVLHGYGQSPTMPVYMVEANYEGENNGVGGSDPDTTLRERRQEWWTMLSGASGQLYGNHFTVGTTSVSSTWNSSSNIDTTAVTQLGYMKTMLSALPWQLFVPDTTNVVTTAGFGTYSSTGTVDSSNYATTARASDGSTVVVYMPTSRTITVDMSKLSATVRARWFDPTNGTFSNVAGGPFANSGTHNFTPTGNNAGGDGDWVLVLTNDG